MRRYAPWIVGLALLAGTAHFAAVWAVPRIVMAVAMRRLSAQAGVNHEAHGKAPTAASRAVVMPSPDLVYTTCVFDLSAGPLEITARVPPTYWSVALYAANSDNFFVMNDRQAPANRQVRIVLIPKSMQVSAQSGEQIVQAPTRRGIVLFRTLVAFVADPAAVLIAQQEMQCRPLEP